MIIIIIISIVAVFILMKLTPVHIIETWTEDGVDITGCKPPRR